MRTLLVSLTLLLPLTAVAAPKAAPKPMAVCVNQATGSVTARAKCKAGESPLNLSAVAASTIGPKGDPGAKGDQGAPGIINVASCYKKEGEWQLTNDGYAYADATCTSPSTEFMLSDGMDYQPYVDLFISDRNPTFQEGDTVPTGISISTGSLTKVYQLRAVITCCKR